MATTSLQSLHQSFLHRPQRHHHHHFTNSPDSIFFKPAKSYKLFSNLSSSSLSTASSAAATSSSPFDALASHLSSSDFREADEETRRLLIELAGEAAQKRGYVFFSEVQFIPAADLQAIDQLWRQHSGGRFGYSVQRRLWEKSSRDFTRLFIRLGWMKKLDSEVEQYSYRSFPSEFIWELNGSTPEGHLPLTNALRGTQLFRSILTHTAFEESVDEEGEKSEDEGGTDAEKEKPKLMGANTFLKPDYSF
ncbi:hypothetical protein Cni_G20032 [Canna indica]|uniref:GUN4-like domain-containing protein n=1 Tax=Canna indica TaxID=4628 RepID=A0AAQ3KNC1_9LILI|nr:hypothetical protein Cni_G20032 [Canna indica]